MSDANPVEVETAMRHQLRLATSRGFAANAIKMSRETYDLFQRRFAASGQAIFPSSSAVSEYRGVRIEIDDDIPTGECRVLTGCAA